MTATWQIEEWGATRMNSRWGIAILLASATPSCGLVPNHTAVEPPDAYFRTDRASYTLSPSSPQATIIVHYRNAHPFSVYFRACGEKNPAEEPPTVGTRLISQVIWSKSGIDSQLGLQWACLSAPRREIVPGGILIDSVWVHRAAAPGAVYGRYQIVYWAYDRPAASEMDEAGLLALPHRRSNVFIIDTSREF